MASFAHWVTAYGYEAIFVLLALGIVGLPVPDETLLTYCGFLVYRGALDWTGVCLAAFGGSLCGISLSYILGRTFGLYLLHRYGRYVRVTNEGLDRVRDWFGRRGRWALFFGYFVPGARHLTAYVAGASRLDPRLFAAAAFPGGLLWCSTFLALGYFLGNQWTVVASTLHRYRWPAAALVLAVLVAWLFFRLRRPRSV